MTFNNPRTTINTARNRPETERGKETSKTREEQETRKAKKSRRNKKGLEVEKKQERTRSREETSKKFRSHGIVTWPSEESIEVEVKAISWNK